MPFLITLLVIIIVIVMSSIRIVPQAYAYVVERLGTYTGTWSVGMHFKTPIIDKVAKKVTLKSCRIQNNVLMSRVNSIGSPCSVFLFPVQMVFLVQVLNGQKHIIQIPFSICSMSYQHGCMTAV